MKENAHLHSRSIKDSQAGQSTGTLAEEASLKEVPNITLHTFAGSLWECVSFRANFNFIRITSLIFNCLKGREKKSSPKRQHKDLTITEASGADLERASPYSFIPPSFCCSKTPGRLIPVPWLSLGLRQAYLIVLSLFLLWYEGLIKSSYPRKLSGEFILATKSKHSWNSQLIFKLSPQSD